MDSISWDPQVAAFLEAALGAEVFARMRAALCVPPLSTCLRVNTLKCTVQDVMQQLHSVAKSSQPAPGVSTHPQLPVALLLKGTGPNHIDPAACSVSMEVVISRRAGEAVLRGAQVFVPGVLACSAGLAAGDRVAVTVAVGAQGSSHGAITRYTILQPADATADSINPSSQQPDISSSNSSNKQQCNGNGRIPFDGRMCVGIGRAAMSRTEMFRAQSGVAVTMEQRVYDVPSLNGALKGKVMLQNLPSIVAAHVLNPTPGSRALDMCAAPGGKTTLLVQIMQGQGEVVAVDRSHTKVDDIRALVAELGCQGCVQAHKLDSTKAVCTTSGDKQEDNKQLRQTDNQQQQQQQQHDGDHSQQQPSTQQQQQQQLSQQQNGVDHAMKCRQPALHMQDGCVQNKNSILQPTQQLQEQQLAAEQQQQRPHPLVSMHEQLQQHQQQGQRQQQQQVVAACDQLLSAKARARLQRRIAAMAARGQSPPAAEYRYYGLGPSKHPGFPPESFDYVLLDAPCTALGLRPRLLQQHSLDVLLETARYQRQLLAAAVQLLKPGGFMVYSTCTISPAENEMNVRHVLDTYPFMQLVPAEPRLGGPGLAGPADHQALQAALNAAVAAAAAGRKAQKQAAADTGAPAATVASVPASNTAKVFASTRPACSVVKAADGEDGRVSNSNTGSKANRYAAWGLNSWLSPAEVAMVQRFDPAGPEDTIGFFIAKFYKLQPCS